MKRNEALWGPFKGCPPENIGPTYHLVQLHGKRGVWGLDYNDSSGKWMRKSLGTRDKAEALKRRKIWIEYVENQAVKK